MKKYSMVGMVLVVLLLGVSTAVATVAATDTVTRTLPETVSPGDTATVSLTINFDDQTAVDRLVITETVPAGWEIVDASNNGILTRSGKISWIIIGMLGGTIPADGAVFTYNVTVPPDASGTYPFSGIYGTNTAGTNLNVLGDANLTVGPVDTITRTLPETAFPGDTVTVSLAIDFDDQTAVDRLVITETVPAGWEIVDASNNGILTRSGKISWIIIGMLGGTIPSDGAVFTYNVTVPPDASGTYPFSGIYGTNTAGTNLNVLGDANLTVGHVDTITRTLPETAFPGDTVTVSLAIDFDDQTAVDRLVITETVPAGWEIVDASDSGILTTPGKISWVIIEMLGGTIPPDGAVFTYNVTVPPDASGTYPFSGIYGTNTAGTNLNVLGDANLNIDTCDPPTLKTYTITNTTITPPQTTSIDVKFSERVSATIKIEDTVGNLIKQLYHSSGVTNPSPKHWDGTYTNGATVPDGIYIVNVTGVSTTTGLSVINTSEAITVITNAE